MPFSLSLYPFNGFRAIFFLSFTHYLFKYAFIWHTKCSSLFLSKMRPFPVNNFHEQKKNVRIFFFISFDVISGLALTCMQPSPSRGLYFQFVDIPWHWLGQTFQHKQQISIKLHENCFLFIMIINIRKVLCNCGPHILPSRSIVCAHVLLWDKRMIPVIEFSSHQSRYWIICTYWTI